MAAQAAIREVKSPVLQPDASASFAHANAKSIDLLQLGSTDRSHHVEIESSAKRSHRNLLITGFVLSMIGLFFFAGGFVNWGVATLPNVMRSGFGVLHQFVGTHCLMLGIAHMASALVFLAAAHYRRPRSDV